MKVKAYTAIATFFLSCMIVAGCTSTAQKKAKEINQQLTTVTRNGAQCMQNVNNSDVGQKLAEILIIRGPGKVKNKFQKVRISRKIRDNELDTLDMFMKKAGKCRKQILEGLSKAHPAFVKVMVDQYSRLDSITVDLAQKDITIGKANEEILQSYDSFQSELQKARQRVNNQLQELRENEMEKRQAAVQALQQWSYQQQKLQNQQKLMNELRTPTYTDCQYVGSTLSCTSY